MCTEELFENTFLWVIDSKCLICMPLLCSYISRSCKQFSGIKDSWAESVWTLASSSGASLICNSGHAFFCVSPSGASALHLKCAGLSLVTWSPRFGTILPCNASLQAPVGCFHPSFIIFMFYSLKLEMSSSLYRSLVLAHLLHNVLRSESTSVASIYETPKSIMRTVSWESGSYYFSPHQ